LKESASPRSLTDTPSPATCTPPPPSPQPFELVVLPSLTIPRDEIFTSYTINYLLRGLHDDQVVHQPEIDRKLTDECFLALSTTYFGAAHEDKSILQQGFQRYGLALERIYNALGDPSRYRSFDLLHAVVVAALFEVSLSWL
jgi:hypothetical protein